MPGVFADEVEADKPRTPATAEVPTAAPPAKTNKPNKPSAAKPTAAAAKAAQADAEAALAFAREHHPELEDVLSRLKKSNRAEFRRAVRDLNQARVRLERIQEKTPNRYAPALEDWKLESQIRLLAARSAMSDDGQIENELKTLIKQRIERRVATLTEERDRLAARVAKLDEQIKQQGADVDARVATELEKLRKSVAAKAPARKQPKAPKSATAPAASDAPAGSKAPKESQ